MFMLECEGKALLRQSGIRVPRGAVVERAEDALARAEAASLAPPIAVKAQVRAGRRGKEGGVVRAEGLAETEAIVRFMLGRRFAGERACSVLLEPWSAVERELYLSVTVEGETEGHAVLYAPDGGIEIESGPPPVRYSFGAFANFRTWRLRAALEPVEADVRVREKVVALAGDLVRLAAARDCTMIEINPLAVLADGELQALDAKIVRDDWAHFRQADIADSLAADRLGQPELVRACLDMQHAYVPLEGDIALISGGAGMTMAAMDMIADHGGRPACFLDCSPGPASTRGYRPAFAMLDADPGVKVILVSVFGGGTHMDRVAGAMREILGERRATKPVVFRLDGTHVDQVDGLLATVGAFNHPDLESAVRTAVRLAAEVP